MQPPAANTLPQPAHRLATARSRYHSNGTGAMSGGRLLVMLYQRLVRDLNGAHAAIEGDEVEAAHANLVHAQEIVDQLDAALDRSAWDQAEQMSSIYDFLRRQLLQANVTKDAFLVMACLRIVEPLTSGWEEALLLTGGGVGS